MLRTHLFQIKFICIAMALMGCTPMQSRIDPPYPFMGDEFSEAEIQNVAAEYCGFPNTEALPTNIHPFTTDGCTLWPDGDWRECCIAHDMLYWCSVDRISRKEADRALRNCVKKRDSPVNAFIMYMGTRLTAPSWLPVSWRWGYGYRWLDKPESKRSASPLPEIQE